MTLMQYVGQGIHLYTLHKTTSREMASTQETKEELQQWHLRVEAKKEKRKRET